MAVDLVCDVCVEAQVGYAHGGELLLPSSEHQNETWNAFVSGFTGVARVVSGLTLGMTARYEHLVFPAPTGPDVNLAYGELFAGFVLARGRAIEHGPRLGVGTFWVPKNGRAEIGAIDVRYWVSGRVSERWSIVGEAGLWFSHDHIQASITAGLSFALSQSPSPPEEPEPPPPPKPKPLKPGEYEPLPIDTWP
ncbi:MAG: hypothetical protein ACXVEF_05395 [Polyangiales bacterium]